MAPPQHHSSLMADSLGANDRYFAANHINQDSDAESHGEEKVEGEPPLFSAGIVSDIQYAPIPDGFSYNGAPRFYRYALEATRIAAAHFHRDNVPVVVQLGDIVDGKCQDILGNGGIPLDEGVHIGQACVQDVVEAFSKYTENGDCRTVIHTYGNHCLYNLDRMHLQKLLGLPFVHETETDELVGYFSYVHKHIRFVVVDSYDVCLMRRSPLKAKWIKAHEILGAKNRNYPRLENSPEGLEGLDKRFVAFNGGIDTPQLGWLRNTLQEAQDLDQKVIILSHQPIHPTSTNPVCLMWNYDEVLDLLREFCTTVIASLSGHAHKGGYHRDEISGIHFRVVEAALEHKPPTYALLDVYQDRIALRGQGLCESATYDFAHMDGKWSPLSVAAHDAGFKEVV